MYTSTTVTPIFVQMAQLVGLSTSLFLSGANFGASHLALPVLHQTAVSGERASPRALASLYHRTARAIAPLAALSTLASALAAIHHGPAGPARAVWAGVAALVLMMFPFTRILLRETGQALRRAGGGAAGDEESYCCRKGMMSNETEALLWDVEEKNGEVVEAGVLRRWRRLNLIRSILALWAGLLAGWAVVFLN
ncbi:hypothetical protein BX600DRAFT_431118 [Xylariales sp. PMI_506]|nr:hypothetical protein BX600DRAFT_431118 [Xylariales sp. PMI_506]